MGPGRGQSRGRQRSAAPLNAAAQPTSWESPEAEVYRAELRRLLVETINQLPPTFREVVRLRDIEERSNAEVADTLHVSSPDYS